MWMRLSTIVVCVSFIVCGSSCSKSTKVPDDPKAEVRDSESSGTTTVIAPLNQAKKSAISKLWDDTDNKWGAFKSHQPARGRDVTIKYRIFANPDQKTKKKAAIVISSGRTECMFKYDETIYDLYQLGYSVYIHDHRGQGFSDSTIERNLPPQEGHGPGHVNDFAFYVDDLHQFVTNVVQPSQRELTQSDQNLLLLGHSMGGCIASRYIEKHKTVFAAAVLCSPMHEPDAGLLPGVLAEGIAAILNMKGREEDYAGGGKANENKVYDRETAKNVALTHSKERHDRIRQMFSSHPETLVGGASYWWVQRAYEEARYSIDDAGKIEIDVLLLQATEDIAVTPEGQFAFRDALNAAHPGRCTLVPIKGGYHELLIEEDTIRNKALEAIIKFFDEHAVTTSS